LKIALKAQQEFKEMTVIDLFSIKPVDEKTIYECAMKSGGKILTVEDHFKEGGLHGIFYRKSL
jgi:transketolase